MILLMKGVHRVPCPVKHLLDWIDVELLHLLHGPEASTERIQHVPAATETLIARTSPERRWCRQPVPLGSLDSTHTAQLDSVITPLSS